MKLTQKQRDKLWGEDGPYSEACLIFESRILDDSISRIFVVVEVHVNPFTYETIKHNRDEFANDIHVQQLIDHSEFRGEPFGYVSCFFREEYNGKNILEDANIALGYAEKTVIKMHKFVLKLLYSDYKKKN